MKELLEELIEIMDEECKGYDKWEETKPIIINIYVEGEK